MKKICETTIIDTGGRAGEVYSPDKSFSYTITSSDIEKENTINPGQLFATAYSACFNSASELVMNQKKAGGKSIVATHVSLFQGEDGFSAGAELEVRIDGVDQAKAEELVRKAHEICSYSKATRSNIDVKLTVI